MGGIDGPHKLQVHIWSTSWIIFDVAMILPGINPLTVGAFLIIVTTTVNALNKNTSYLTSVPDNYNVAYFSTFSLKISFQYC